MWLGRGLCVSLEVSSVHACMQLTLKPTHRAQKEFCIYDKIYYKLNWKHKIKTTVCALSLLSGWTVEPNVIIDAIFFYIDIDIDI